LAVEAGELIVVRHVEEDGMWIFARSLARHASETESEGWLAVSACLMPFFAKHLLAAIPYDVKHPVAILQKSYLQLCVGDRITVQYVGSEGSEDETWAWGLKSGIGGWFPAAALLPKAMRTRAQLNSMPPQLQPHVPMPTREVPVNGCTSAGPPASSLAAVCRAAEALQPSLQLIGALAHAPAADAWEYPLADVMHRSFVGHLSSPFGNRQCEKWKEFIMNGVIPLRARGMSRGTKWMVKPGCRCPYRYGAVTVLPVEFPSWMDKLMGMCMPAFGFRERESWPNSCNLNFYFDGGDAIDWHADDEELFEGTKHDCRILSLSLGEERCFELCAKHPPNHDRSGDTFRIRLASGDLCTMEGLTQKFYEHRIKKCQSKGLRVNLTWRWITAHDRRRCGLK
jgi:hypothetical protein